eukprot:TRINITY_DN7312_c3_g1_i1.p1 TRINITY_DN7312_c3_g1~~TRINITY_DN7312_c3_g1_i1.p1  ORF type:complete len:644 (+),score=87.76 TRINITY_DN7312_c3_g1_i1:83-2014(+)
MICIWRILLLTASLAAHGSGVGGDARQHRSQMRREPTSLEVDSKGNVVPDSAADLESDGLASIREFEGVDDNEQIRKNASAPDIATTKDGAYHQYYRLNVKLGSNEASNWCVGKLQFYLKKKKKKTATNKCGEPPCCSSTTTSDSFDLETACSSAFGNDPDAMFCTAMGKKNSGTLTYDFGQPVQLDKYVVQEAKQTGNESHSPKSWLLEGSLDGVFWEVLDSKNQVMWEDYGSEGVPGALTMPQESVRRIETFENSTPARDNLVWWGIANHRVAYEVAADSYNTKRGGRVLIRTDYWQNEYAGDRYTIGAAKYIRTPFFKLQSGPISFDHAGMGGYLALCMGFDCKRSKRIDSEELHRSHFSADELAPWVNKRVHFEIVDDNKSDHFALDNVAYSGMMYPDLRHVFTPYIHFDTFCGTPDGEVLDEDYAGKESEMECLSTCSSRRNCTAYAHFRGKCRLYGASDVRNFTVKGGSDGPNCNVKTQVQLQQYRYYRIRVSQDTIKGYFCIGELDFWDVHGQVDLTKTKECNRKADKQQPCCKADSTYPGYGCANAFSPGDSTYYCSHRGNVTGSLTYDFGKPVALRAYQVKQLRGWFFKYSPEAWKLQASNDEESWKTLDAATDVEWGKEGVSGNDVSGDLLVW